jgi:hypothetical protein
MADGKKFRETVVALKIPGKGSSVFLLVLLTANNLIINLESVIINK